MGEYRCQVCEDVVLRRAVDEELFSGKTATSISRLMGLRGSPLSAGLILGHKKHFRAQAEREIAVREKRDLAIMVQEEAIDLFEQGDLSLTDRNHIPGIKAGLDAQAILDRREARKEDHRIGMFILMLGGADGQRRLAPPDLVGEDEDIVEGEATEID